jgi:hypothetical protein
MADAIGIRKENTCPTASLDTLMQEHLDALRAGNYSTYTTQNRLVHIGFFIAWLRGREIASRTSTPSKKPGPNSNNNYVLPKQEQPQLSTELSRNSSLPTVYRTRPHGSGFHFTLYINS